MKVLVTGSGQLAWELARTVPPGVELVALGRSELDISSAEQVRAQLELHQPDAVINAAAYTAVDKAEQERDLAFAVNATAVGLLAQYCQTINAYFLHISTDFVFDGRGCLPYACDGEKKPLGVYGESKSAGEDLIPVHMPTDWAVIRTSWVYSSHGNNFVKTMLRLMTEKPQLSVVGDQIGTPTWARGLALACWAAIDKKAQGIYHWTDAGVASWYDFAVAIQRVAQAKGLIRSAIPILSIPSSAYPSPAARPAYSVLDKARIINELGLAHIHWQDHLSTMMAESRIE